MWHKCHKYATNVDKCHKYATDVDKCHKYATDVDRCHKYATLPLIWKCGNTTDASLVIFTGQIASMLPGSYSVAMLLSRMYFEDIEPL